MPFTGFADPAQLSMLTKVLDEYCRDHRIADATMREDLARRLIVLFNDGARDARSLLAALDEAGRREAAWSELGHREGGERWARRA